MNSSSYSHAFSGARLINTARLSFAALLLLPALSQNAFAEGLGTEASPYLIPDAASITSPLNSGCYYEVTGSGLHYHSNDTPWIIGENTTGNYLTIGSAGTGLNAYPGIALGDSTGSGGTLEVTGNTTVYSWAFDVGWAGSGTMKINAGAKVQSSGGGTDKIGGGGFTDDVGATGNVVISGSGSKWTTGNELEIGGIGTGTVAITGGGALDASTNAVYVGVNYVAKTGATNNVITVSGRDASGNSSALVVASTLYLGWGNQGTLILSDGGLAKLGAIAINSGRNGFGIIYMDGGYLALAGNLSESAINTILGYTRVGDSSSYTSAVLGSNIYAKYFGSGSGQMIGGYDVSNYTVLSTTEIGAVPEPATYAFFGGLGALGFVLLRRKRK
jgi:T5SS/PEP-CTERM-associated repeat protein